MNTLFRFVVGLLFLPACFVQTHVFYASLRQIKTLDGNEIYFVYGVFGYFLIHTLLFKPVSLYMWAHEAVHALVTMVFGGAVQSVKVSKKGGETKTTKTNLMVEIAPYFTPLYTFLLCAVTFILVRLFDLEAWQDFFFFLIGFSLTFHVVMTVDFLKTKQPDLLRLGPFLSVEVIYLGNLFVAVFILAFVFPEVSPGNYFVNAFTETGLAYKQIYQQLFL